jgi:hypothetical protein
VRRAEPSAIVTLVAWPLPNTAAQISGPISPALAPFLRWHVAEHQLDVSTAALQEGRPQSRHVMALHIPPRVYNGITVCQVSVLQWVLRTRVTRETERDLRPWRRGPMSARIRCPRTYLPRKMTRATACSFMGTGRISVLPGRRQHRQTGHWEGR